jgi:hypothetical protein
MATGEHQGSAWASIVAAIAVAGTIGVLYAPLLAR